MKVKCVDNTSPSGSFYRIKCDNGEINKVPES